MIWPADQSLHSKSLNGVKLSALAPRVALHLFHWLRSPSQKPSVSGSTKIDSTFILFLDCAARHFFNGKPRRHLSRPVGLSRTRACSASKTLYDFISQPLVSPGWLTGGEANRRFSNRREHSCWSIRRDRLRNSSAKVRAGVCHERWSKAVFI